VIDHYQELAYRTAKKFNNFHADLNHAALGLASESGELSETIVRAWMQMPVNAHNIEEELGDGCWYAALMATVMELDFKSLFLHPGDLAEMSPTLASAVLGRNPVALTMCLTAFSGELVSVVKAHVIYGKELDHIQLSRALSLYVCTASLLADLHGLDFETQVLAGNIQKLQKRFPGFYSDAEAVARADKAEAGETPSIILAH
jgi:NTP pyrophosphatase (non-canonical NTP hydrolase)